MPEIRILDNQTESVQYLASKDKRLAKAMKLVGTITYQPYYEPFSFIVHEIIEQMLSIKVGTKIYSRLEELCGGDITPERINSVTEEAIRGTGTSLRKAKNIKALAETLIEGTLSFEAFKDMSDAEIIKELSKLPGIGVWTAKMYLIFVLDRQDVLPYEDSAFLQSYQWLYKTNELSPEAVKKKCKKWKPYASVAARFLYKALDYGITKKEFHLFK